MSKLELTLPQPVLFVLYQLHLRGLEGYVVGGAVRDILLNRDTQDWDFATNARPEIIQQIFPGSFYDNLYGTVGLPVPAVLKQMSKAGWLVDSLYLNDPRWQNEVMEVTTYRTESQYSDYRRPDLISWGESIEADLSRRDFTINALALNANQMLRELQAFIQKQAATTGLVTLIDPYDGQTAIKQGIIQAVRDPNERFQEDALRMMRAIRFGAQLGFTIESQTLLAIQQHAPLLQKISQERIRDELFKILASAYPAQGITLLANAALLPYILPELLPMRGVKQGGHHIYDVYTHSLEALKACPSPDPLVRLAVLLHDVGKPKTQVFQGPRGVTFYGHEVVGAHMAKRIGERLRLSRKEIDRLYLLVRWHMFVYNPEMTDAAIRRFIKRVGLENINDMILLRIGDRKGGGSQATSWRLRELQKRIGAQLYEPLSLKDLKINGTDIMKALNLPPGPKIGQILNRLFDEVMEDTSKNTRDYLLKKAQEIA